MIPKIPIVKLNPDIGTERDACLDIVHMYTEAGCELLLTLAKEVVYWALCWQLQRDMMLKHA